MIERGRLSILNKACANVIVAFRIPFEIKLIIRYHYNYSVNYFMCGLIALIIIEHTTAYLFHDYTFKKKFIIP